MYRVALLMVICAVVLLGCEKSPRHRKTSPVIQSPPVEKTSAGEHVMSVQSVLLNILSPAMNGWAFLLGSLGGG